MRRSPLLQTLMFISTLLPEVAAGQSPAPAQDPMLACVAQSERGDLAGAARVGGATAQVLRDRLTLKPDDVPTLVALARVISQCQIPAAELIQQGELSAQAVELLEHALQLQPSEWLARYLLAQNYFRAPAFLGRADAAARQFDLLISQQGGRSQPAIFARPFEFRGLLWLRAGQRDSARAVWARGLELFPQDSMLVRRMRALNESPPVKPPTSDSALAAPVGVQAVVVQATRLRAGPAFPQPRAVRRMDVLMSPGSAADVLQALQLQGGATLVGDGAELHARGGDPAETPLIVNGSPMLGAVRFESFDGGLFGALDPQVLRETQFSPGGFSVRVGNALSGVVEAETDGRPREAHQRVGVSSVTASATASTPVGAKAGAWGSVRASNTTAMLWMNGRSNEFTSAPQSLDAIGSVTIVPSGLTEIRLVGLVAADAVTRDAARADYSGPYGSAGGSGFAGLSARHVSPSAPVITKLAIAASGRRATQRFGVLDRTRGDAVVSARSDAEWRGTAELRLRGGADAELFVRDEHGNVPATQALAPGAPMRVIDRTATAGHGGMWGEAAWERGRLSLIGGLRADRLPGESSVTVDPRVNAVLAIGGARVHAAIGMYHQGSWRPSPDQTSPVLLLDVPTEAVHWTAGIERDGGDWMWRAEGFEKRYARYVARGGLPVVGGSVRGIDALVRRPARSGRVIDGWAVYSATRSRVRLASGGEIPGAFDVTHALTLVTMWRPDDRWRVGTTLRAATGAPTTDVVSSDSTGGTWQPHFGPPNGARLPHYTRSDVRLTRLVPSDRGMAALFVEAINFLDRQNVSSWAYDSTWRGRTPVAQFFGRRTVVVGVEWQVR